MIFREEQAAVYYFISFTENGINFTESNETQIYNEKRSSGIIRKAVVNNPVSKFQGQKFIDSFKFTLPPNCKLVRLYDYFQKELDLFPQNQIQSSYIKKQPFYNSFMSQSGIISYQYTKSLFITQTINSQGYYQYFIKRNGEYFVQQCDDLIPVQNKTFNPIWGLTIDHPWQIILMKAWLKECGSFQAMNNAQPFSFIEAFGLPSYRVFNFRKEKKFLLKERLSKEEKANNLKEFQIYNSNSIILGKTIDHPTVSKIGLIPNTAAYRIQKIKQENGEVLFKVYSSLPCAWVGTNSAVALTPLNKIYSQQLTLDLERTFIMTEKQVLALFHKFYVAPGLFSKPKKFFSQDCINLNVENSTPVWIKFSVLQKAGLLSFSIEAPKKRIGKKYPQFRYFLSKKTDQQQISRSQYKQDIAASKLVSNIHITSTCNKWQYYEIDYVQGYENHSTGFIKVTEGEYVLFVHAQMNGVIRVRIDSQVKIQNIQQFQPSSKLSKQIFDSTFFTISRDSSVQATFNQSTFEQSISLNNSFEQNGFGSICIKTLAKAKHRVAMRVYPDKLREEGYQLLAHYDEYQESTQKQKNFVLMSSNGRPQIIVLQRINEKSRSQIGQIFPPKGCVEFFKVTPNNIFNPMVPVTSSAFK